MWPWKVALLVGALAVVGLLAAVAIASGADKALSGVQDPGALQCDGDGSIRQGQGNGGQGSMMRGVGASEEAQALAEEHRDEMQAWHDQYGDDPNGAEAQAALQRLRQEHWNEMRALLEDTGVTSSEGPGLGARGGRGDMMDGSGSCGGAAGGCAGPTAGSGGQGTGCTDGMMSGPTF